MVLVNYYVNSICNLTCLNLLFKLSHLRIFCELVEFKKMINSMHKINFLLNLKLLFKLESDQIRIAFKN